VRKKAAHGVFELLMDGMKQLEGASEANAKKKGCASSNNGFVNSSSVEKRK
jgi:hypothetical protein